LCLPKIWRVSPPSFPTLIQISWLDMTQNWALKRSARQYMGTRDFARAAKSWEGAIAQNPADPEALRGYLKNSLDIPQPEKHVLIAASSQIPWLLRLTQTNLADLELIARVSEHFEWFETLAHYVAPLVDRVSPSAQAAYTKALFREHRLREFEQRLAKEEKNLSDPELALYRLAWIAGWGKGAERSEAEQALKREIQGGKQNVLAARLYMDACANRSNLQGYSECLEQLATRDEATANDHATYWDLLAANGRKEQAIKLAQAFSKPPASAVELVHLAQSYNSLGLSEQARDLLKRFTPSFRQSPMVWAAYASLLEMEKNWPELHELSVRMRADAAARNILWGYGYMLEGRAEYEQDRKATAEIAFGRAAECGYDFPSIGMLVARELTRMHSAKNALQILSALEPSLGHDFNYWDAVFETAYTAQDSALVLKASEHCYALKPDDIAIRNRYAAALMLNRSNPEEAIQLTLQLYSKFPRSAAAAINHSCALLLNERAGEARALLEKIQPETLGPTESAAYYLALFEAYHALKLWDLAWKTSDRIATGALFPTQQKWLAERRKEMPQRIAGR
jgi:predicted Zn-dependent protease